MHPYLNTLLKAHHFSGFKLGDNIDIDNLRNFLYQVLDKYEKEEIDYSSLLNISDTLENYFYHKYKDQFPESFYPIFEDNDPRSLGFTVMDYIHPLLENFIMFPEDMPCFKKFLLTPLGKELEGYKELHNYVKMFDFEARINEAYERGILGENFMIGKAIKEL